MNGLDWVILVVLGLSILSGFVRGLARTLIGLAGWVVAALVAFRFGEMFGDALLTGIRNPALRAMLAMMVLFLLVGIVTALLGALCARLIRAVGLGLGDRLLGAAFGAARGLAFVMLATVAAGFTTLPQSILWRSSYFGPRLEAWALALRPLLPQALSGLIHFGTEI